MIEDPLNLFAQNQRTINFHQLLIKMLNTIISAMKRRISEFVIIAILVPFSLLIVNQLNIATVNLDCNNVTTLWQQYTGLPTMWSCNKSYTKVSLENISPHVLNELSDSIGGQAHKQSKFDSKTIQHANTNVSSKTDSEKSSEYEFEQNFVKQMFFGAWKNYVSHAWGYESIKPVTNEPVGDKNMGHAIVASMSTLWVMELKDEFNRSEKWVKQELKLGKLNTNVTVFYSVSDYIGGLLSCYALTGDWMFVDKAHDISLILQPAYQSSTGLPYGYVIPKNKTTTSSQVHLTQIGGNQLEHIYLFNLTNDWLIEERIASVRKFVREVEKPKGLYMFKLDVDTGKWINSVSTLWGSSRDFYTNLIKSYIQSNGQNVEALKWYIEAMEAVFKNGLFKITDKKQFYSTSYNVAENKYRDNEMCYTACYLGAMFSLGANAIKQSLGNFKVAQSNNNLLLDSSFKVEQHWQLAKEITETCHQGSVNTATNLTPLIFYFDGLRNRYNNENEYTLRPDLAESYFIMWRLTHDQKYRDYAWEMAKAIHKHCRTENGGYSTIKDVHKVPTEKLNDFPLKFMSATLKYLYLTFTEDSVMPLDKWVFNSAGHPLPICGTSDTYPKC